MLSLVVVNEGVKAIVKIHGGVYIPPLDVYFYSKKQHQSKTGTHIGRVGTG